MSTHRHRPGARSCHASGEHRASGCRAGYRLLGWRPRGVTVVQKDGAPGQRDAEEFIEVHRLDMVEVRDMLTACDMLLPSMTTAFLAFDKLVSMGQL